MEVAPRLRHRRRGLLGDEFLDDPFHPLNKPGLRAHLQPQYASPSDEDFNYQNPDCR